MSSTAAPQPQTIFLTLSLLSRNFIAQFPAYLSNWPPVSSEKRQSANALRAWPAKELLQQVRCM